MMIVTFSTAGYAAPAIETISANPSEVICTSPSEGSVTPGGFIEDDGEIW